MSYIIGKPIAKSLVGFCIIIRLSEFVHTEVVVSSDPVIFDS